MATRSMIGIRLTANTTMFGKEYKKGTIISVYCHSDGYPEDVGARLQRTFNTEAKAIELISGGYMSSCYKKITGAGGVRNEMQQVDGSWKYVEVPNPVHSFATPTKDETVYYARDRGEHIQWDVDTSMKSYACADGMIAYYYIFKDGIWKVSQGSSFRKF